MGRKALRRALEGFCTLIGLLVLPGAASAAECTSTWTGAVSGVRTWGGVIDVTQERRLCSMGS